MTATKPAWQSSIRSASLADYYNGKYAPGFLLALRSTRGVPLSGQPNRFAYPDPRFGAVLRCVWAPATPWLRGGWGVYRFVTQVNTVDSPLFTAQDVLGYNIARSDIDSSCRISKPGLCPARRNQPLQQRRAVGPRSK